jgi:hypothetical protein
MKDQLRGTRYWTSTEVDALMVYDAFYKFGTMWYTWEEGDYTGGI